jgi:hypothetical protein
MLLRVLRVLFFFIFGAFCQGKVRLHEIELDQCGEATVDPLIKDAIVDFGLSEGTCAEQGYDRAAGNKEIDVPLVGKVTVELYDKKHPPRVRINEGSLEEYLHAWKVSTDRCSEAFVHPTMKGYLVETGFSEGTCAGQGYDVTVGREQIDVPYAGGVDITVDLDLYSKRSLIGAMLNTAGDLRNSQGPLEKKIHLWKTFAGRCGEAFIDPMAKAALVELAFVEGTCAEQGYDVAAGGKEIEVSLMDFMDKVTLKLYDKKHRLRPRITEGSIDKKPRLRARIIEGSLEGYIHLCKMSDGQCSEAFIDSVMLGALAETSFSEGTCAGHGYDVPAGVEEIDIPYIGGVDITIDVRLYSKPSRRLLLV